MAAISKFPRITTPRDGTPNRRRTHVLGVRSEKNSPLELPGGAYWWFNTNKKSDTVVYGPNFVLSRPGRVGGEGLIPANKNSAMQPFIRPGPSAPPALRPTPQPMNLALSGVIVIDTEFEVLPSTTPMAVAVAASPPQCTGIVHLGSTFSQMNENNKEYSNSFMNVQDIGRAQNRHHPRRTRRVRFLCNLCNEVNEKDINPRAWRTGSVFARCDGCSAVHKLKDNLKVGFGWLVFP